jgi:hypothetical protein
MSEPRTHEVAWSIGLGVLIAAAVIAIGLLTGVLTCVNRFPGLTARISDVWSALGSSVVFFTLDLVAFVVSLALLRGALGRRDVETSVQLSTYNSLFVNLFFGIGVIYTAIGMQSALIHALGGLDESAVERFTAWVILDRLIHGGIITALMTTIVGGVGGYVMRLVRQAVVGRRLQRLDSRVAALAQNRPD